MTCQACELSGTDKSFVLCKCASTQTLLYLKTQQKLFVFAKHFLGWTGDVLERFVEFMWNEETSWSWFLLRDLHSTPKSAGERVQGKHVGFLPISSRRHTSIHTTLHVKLLTPTCPKLTWSLKSGKRWCATTFFVWKILLANELIPFLFGDFLPAKSVQETHFTHSLGLSPEKLGTLLLMLGFRKASPWNSRKREPVFWLLNPDANTPGLLVAD